MLGHRCNVCRKIIELNSDFLRCPSCNYDICSSCHKNKGWLPEEEDALDQKLQSGKRLK